MLQSFTDAAFVLTSSAMVLYPCSVAGTPSELAAMSVICGIAVVLTLGYYIRNVCRFSDMIEYQIKQYKTDFRSQNSVTVSKLTLWVICSDDWLIQPGRIALHRKHVQTAGITEHMSRQAILYWLKIKTKDNRVYIMKFKSEKAARAARIWVRRSRS